MVNVQAVTNLTPLGLVTTMDQLDQLNREKSADAIERGEF